MRLASCTCEGIERHGYLVFLSPRDSHVHGAVTKVALPPLLKRNLGGLDLVMPKWALICMEEGGNKLSGPSFIADAVLGDFSSRVTLLISCRSIYPGILGVRNRRTSWLSTEKRRLYFACCLFSWVHLR